MIDPMKEPCSAMLATCHEFAPSVDMSCEDDSEIFTYVGKRWEEELITRMERLGCSVIKRTTKLCYVCLTFIKPLTFQ
jgi:hypothetical protein